ncbi:ScbR family autoregulator-binding transcription factor [Streptomyces albireticuli]|uniref:TetR family transcriptional regulator n=1 Tax=Streptomyces albireticuli TaxID=1940 RepID=A0A2A2D6M7_9ACTN|nr:ScbR family autoregulator-binding transcription factor [Streptomyces albireticuli]MCD9196414.1 TetR family transcriptional regulator [Streptomyces albireticuli]PAU48138.1 TetR family transcriptional regulator [Streptomyces albireticuli]
MTKQERAINTRHALIRSAAQAFDQHGYTRAKLSGISAGAGVSSGALHFHFDTKAAMAAAVEAEAARTLHAVARTVHRRSTGALQALIDASHLFAQQLRWDIVVRAGFRLNGRTPQAPESDLRGQWAACVGRALRQAAEEGALLPGAAQEDMTATIVGATTGFEALARHDRAWLSRPTVTGLWQALLPSLATPETLTRLQPAGTEAVTEAAGDGGAPESGPRPALPTTT